MKEILTILIFITSTVSVKHKDRIVNMINFEGKSESEYFTGKVMSGGVDTQFGDSTSYRLSARYMLEGIDKAGNPCHIFIENEGFAGEPYTAPKILTDSPSLSFLNDAKLKGKVDDSSGQLTIRIYLSE